MSDQSASPAHAREFPALPSQSFLYGNSQRGPLVLPPRLPPEAARMEVPLDELSFFRLTAPSDIAEIHHLRAALALPASALADPDFHAREKKEIRSDSSAPSNTRGNSLEPSASFH